MNMNDLSEIRNLVHMILKFVTKQIIYSFVNTDGRRDTRYLSGSGKILLCAKLLLAKCMDGTLLPAKLKEI